MNPEYYLFTAFVFALLCVLLFLYWRLVVIPRGKKPLSDEEHAREKEKEERLFRLYQNMEEMMDSFEAYIEDTREQMEAMKAEIKQHIEKSDGLLHRVEATEAKALAAVAALRPQDKAGSGRDGQASAEGKPAENGKRSTRQEAIRELLNKGMTVEHIAQKLELSINEVRLVVYGLMTKKE